MLRSKLEKDWLGDNCKYCLCSRCVNKPECGVLDGDTQAYCEDSCLGENRYLTSCEDFERSKSK